MDAGTDSADARAFHDHDRLVKFDELEPLFGIDASYVTIFRWEQRKKFPKRIALSRNKIAWRHSDIARWLAELAPAAPRRTSKRTPSVSAPAVV
ncbi:MAG: AlpA family transcriptional regulator [Sulfuricaulis sp.]|uniref:helix-turn-helix transcriptional regulator n=1 Tax=Sulfuricaulis sp. TaxID=2003553 RepID=UPI0025E07F34|nr:AlpA family phage regulatory protein [Sulfuricaulis sp.]MCR4346505.1 AlpA family transcriptional regulator [Sulfuricaulis sp.]